MHGFHGRTDGWTDGWIGFGSNHPYASVCQVYRTGWFRASFGPLRRSSSRSVDWHCDERGGHGGSLPEICARRVDCARLGNLAAMHPLGASWDCCGHCRVKRGGFLAVDIGGRSFALSCFLRVLVYNVGMEDWHFPCEATRDLDSRSLDFFAPSAARRILSRKFYVLEVQIWSDHQCGMLVDSSSVCLQLDISAFFHQGLQFAVNAFWSH